MGAGKDYYQVLGVPRGATDKEIKAAYRRLARKNHPDVNPGDSAAEARFKEISGAYEVLSDPEKRKKYDAFGAGFDIPGGPPGAGGAPGAGGFTFRPGERFEFGGGDLGDLFGGLFGRRSAAPPPGEDLQHELEVTLEEAYTGSERRMTITSPDVCPTCRGGGGEPGSGRETCPACKGSGRGHQWGGITLGNEPCDRCRGTGQAPVLTCHTCRGQGHVERPRGVTVTIPKAVDTGSKLRIAGQGNPGGTGGPAGDLYLILKVKPHSLFERKGDDLVVEVPVTFPEAALGAEVQIPTLSGKVTMRIPAGVQSGQQLRLAGQGMPRRSGGYGDLFARLRVTVPRNLTNEEHELITRLRELRPENPRERLLIGGSRAGGPHA